jgi:hypothetical protein
LFPTPPLLLLLLGDAVEEATRCFDDLLVFVPDDFDLDDDDMISRGHERRTARTTAPRSITMVDDAAAFVWEGGFVLELFRGEGPPKCLELFGESSTEMTHIQGNGMLDAKNTHSLLFGTNTIARIHNPSDRPTDRPNR